jgi:hypothetical protein
MALNGTTGILAIWHDLDDAFAQRYESWLVSEHIPERLAVPGFLEARRYEAVLGSPRFFISYQVASPQVLASPEYLARLASPTPQTREVMGGFRNMLRTACSLAHRSPGGALGGCAVAAFVEHPSVVDDEALLKGAAQLERDPSVIGVQVWKPEAGPASAASSEAKLRPGGDRSIAAALVVDVLREEDGPALAEVLPWIIRRSTKKSATDELRILACAYRLLGLWRNES